MTSGWACPRCSNSMAPFITFCTFCAKAAAGPEEPGRPLTVRLPDCMRFGGVVVAPVLGNWTEVFPGLEANLRSVRSGLAEVEFRAAVPADGS